jgi:hypothetical protein
MNVLAPKQSKAAMAAHEDSLENNLVNDSEAEEESANDASSSGGLSSSHLSTTDQGSQSFPDEQKVEESAATKQEAKNINRIKALVYLSLIAAAVVVGSLTYYFTKKQEVNTFKREVSQVFSCGRLRVARTKIYSLTLFACSSAFSLRNFRKQRTSPSKHRPKTPLGKCDSSVSYLLLALLQLEASLT